MDFNLITSWRGLFLFLSTDIDCEAERVGFEPTVVHRATTVFETAPFNRSGTSPNDEIIIERI